ncbi:MAG TPA: tRNA epoxyqueuosine(34) reductase QueG [Planctomycetota bacterium]|jgi:epoxyqueuosine reductase
MPTATLTPPQQNLQAKQLAAKHGFALSGIALVGEDGLSPRAAEFSAWLAAGHHGPLDYMQKTQQARTNPRTRFPWARSVLALAAFYDGSPRKQPGRDLLAHVARYARGRDYHLIFERRLKKLARDLVAAGVCSKAHYYVDTGPVLERAWAEAAGVGWIGKNTCLIHPALGSYMLLAEIILDSAPEPDRPHAFHCGSCRRCLDACPTQALVAPGVLDSRRCLVTWNLELRGQTPAEMLSAQGDQAVGCDICQAVCPFNAPAGRDAGRTTPPDPELAAPLPWHTLTLAECIVLTVDRFNAAFVGSALRRAGLKGLRLGAITVAGNLKLSDCRTALEQSAADADPGIAARSQWALSMLRNER